MGKASKVAALVEAMDVGAGDFSPFYLAYFELFNTGEFYEAHDVLEQLWLKETGPDRDFYKGLIQLAGGFVHLRLHHSHPLHPTHSRRLAPAARLFRLAASNLSRFPARHIGISTTSLVALAADHARIIEESGGNPWQPGSPVIDPPTEG